MREGYFTCTAYHRCIYQCSGNTFKNEKYIVLTPELFVTVKSLEEKAQVCETCHKHLLKGKIPCQAVRKIMKLYPARNKLKVITRLERILISKIIFLKKNLKETLNTEFMYILN